MMSARENNELGRSSVGDLENVLQRVMKKRSMGVRRSAKTVIIIAGLWVTIIMVTAGIVWQYTILGEVTLWTLGALVCSAGVFMPLMQIATEPVPCRKVPASSEMSSPRS